VAENPELQTLETNVGSANGRVLLAVSWSGDAGPLVVVPYTPDAAAAVAEVRWKVQMVKGNRALAVPYIDARTVHQRLDDVVGVANWRDDYDVLPDGAVVCRLSLRFGGEAGEWITKVDVGSPSEQPDEGDRRKAAFSDACKRAAVKFGVGRSLYRLPQQWVDYDPQKKQFLRRPVLPAVALPARKPGDPGPAPAGPDAAELVSREQAVELARYINQAGVDHGKWRAYYGVDDTADLPAHRFEEARAVLLRKLEAQPAGAPA
jgi:hypothetical protein